ncbi:uncharacterized protein LOC127103022 [Lathyrus oleraceus]|uniref:uncharacterized protein LOC127103022 n=1 Tax=Pisum sativum TaxID=3888 RepID=UPI0021D03F49|nr:uncharacterized protein LOC127103022 [Pisum sativum]
MLNGPTYPHIVKDLWVRTKFFDEFVASVELNQLIENDSSLKRESREEVCLKKFEEVEIRSAVMGIDVIITQKTIVKLLKAPNSGKFVVNTKDNSPEEDAIKRSMFDNADNLCSFEFRKVKNMHKYLKLLLKILIVCLIHREGSTDQISWDYKNFIFYLKNEDKINLFAYIFNHICEYIKDTTKLHKKNVPYPRLLYELFYQGRLIDALKTFPDNKDLKEIHENIIFAYVLANLKLMKKSDVVASMVPLSIICTYPDYLEEYHVITNKDNPERKKIDLVAQNNVQNPFKKRKEIKEYIDELISSTVLMSSKTRRGRTPPEVSSSSVSLDVPLRRNKSRKLCEIEEDDEEEDLSESLVVRNKVTYVVAQKSVIKSIFISAQLLTSVMLDQSKKLLETFDALIEEVFGVGVWRLQRFKVKN